MAADSKPVYLVAVLAFAVSDFPSYQRAYALSLLELPLGNVESLGFIILGFHWPQQWGLWCQADPGAMMKLSVLSSVTCSALTCCVSVAHKTRLVLPSASLAFQWQDKAHFSNLLEINFLHFIFGRNLIVIANFGFLPQTLQ